MDIKPIEMEPADEQIHMESIVQIESEPMDDMFAEPITHQIPFITYSNRKKYIRNTATTRLSIKIEKYCEQIINKIFFYFFCIIKTSAFYILDLMR